MARHTGWCGAYVTCLILSGCAQLPEYALPPRSLSNDISLPGETLSRAQMQDAPEARATHGAAAEQHRARVVRQSAGQPPIQQTSYANRGTVSALLVPG